MEKEVENDVETGTIWGVDVWSGGFCVLKVSHGVKRHTSFSKGLGFGSLG